MARVRAPAIQERDGNNVPTVSYTRGNDLSGSLEGAGGIGGLLARSHGYSGGSWANHNVYHADGGGNVTYLMTSAQGLAARSGGRLACRKAGPSARRLPVTPRSSPPRGRGPLRRRRIFGRLLSSSGSLAGANLYRFASKEVNPNYPDGGGYYHFGYRFYDPNLQRWLHRDPLGEAGGINLYGFVGNDPLNAVDPEGLSLWSWAMCELDTGLNFGIGSLPEIGWIPMNLKFFQPMWGKGDKGRGTADTYPEALAALVDSDPEDALNPAAEGLPRMGRRHANQQLDKFLASNDRASQWMQRDSFRDQTDRRQRRLLEKVLETLNPLLQNAGRWEKAVRWVPGIGDAIGFVVDSIQCVRNN